MNKYLQNLFITIPVILFSLFRPAYSQIKAPKPLAVGYSVGISGITPKAMDHAQSVGIDYVETSINSYIDQNTLEFKYSDEQIISRIQKAKKALDDAGIEVWSIHMPFGKTIDISFPDDEERKRVLTLHKKVIQFCKILEPKVILFHPSWYLGLNEREIRKSRLIESAVKLNKEVRRIGAIMVIENMLGPQLKAGVDRERPLCRSVEETVEIMNKLPKTIYSAVDMNHIKNPEILIRAMGSRLKSVHIADGTGEQENHYLPCSGKGKNNWQEILTALNEVGYKGPFIYESAHDDVKQLTDCYKELYQKTFLDANSR